MTGDFANSVRQMFGRAGLDLLERRFLLAA